MNGMRRFFLALYSLVLIAACGGLIVLAWNEEQMLDIQVRDFNAVAFIDAPTSHQIAFTAMLGPFILLGLITFLIALVTPSGGAGSRLRLRQADGGTVEVTAASLESLLRDELQRLPEIRQARPRVRLAGGAIDSEIAVVIEPSASIAQVTSLITQTTGQVLKEQVGVSTVRRPRISISYDEISARPVGSEGRPAPRTAEAAATGEEHAPTDD